MSIRLPVPGDASALERLIREYLAESYPGHIGTSATTLRQDVLSGATSQRLLLAERSGRLTGFVAWDSIYDLHWGARGGQVADLYVVPTARGLGVALELLTSLCGAVAGDGGVFIRGGAYNRPSTRAFYERVAIVDTVSGETYLSARAFRHMAALAGAPARTIVRALPVREWNLTE